MAKIRQSEGEELAELITTIQAKYDLSALRALLSGNKQVEAILVNTVNKFAQIGEKTRFSDSEAEFLLKNYPAVKKQVDDALTALHNSLVTAIQSNCEDAWALAEAKNDAIVDAIAKRTKLSPEQVERWKARNTEAAAEFFKRTDRNFNLSRKIWELTDEFKGEMELALDIGLGEGRSAASLAKEMQKYLKDPDKLFRRVRDKHGNLKLSKNAAAYHPGRGKYRSAYKNALRVTGTEGNIAYRTADYERWQQLDFVEGIEINTSHTNHPVADICDELKGVYPKEFKWTGWHPMCRCNATAKMSDFDAFLAKQQEYIDNGTQPDYSDSKVTEMPDNFNRWVKDNEERIASASSLPYFLADNGKVSNGKYKISFSNSMQKSSLNKAKKEADKAIGTLAAELRRTGHLEGSLELDSHDAMNLWWKLDEEQRQKVLLDGKFSGMIRADEGLDDFCSLYLKSPKDKMVNILQEELENLQSGYDVEDSNHYVIKIKGKEPIYSDELEKPLSKSEISKLEWISANEGLSNYRYWAKDDETLEKLRKYMGFVQYKNGVRMRT